MTITPNQSKALASHPQQEYASVPMELRPFQHDVINECRAAIAQGYRSILLVAPTGAGKTVMGASIIHQAETKGNASLFSAHRRELVHQCAKKLWTFGVEHGIIMAGVPMSQWDGVQIASIDTLRARYMNPKKEINFMKLPKVAILMIDEAHRSYAPTYERLIAHYKKEGTIIIGLTATPIRGDGKGLGNLYDYMVLAPSIAELIGMGFLVQPKYYAPTIPDLTGVHIRRGDYVEGELNEIMDHREAVGDIISNWLRICPDRQTIVFASGVRHSMHIAEQFCENGIRAEHVDGETDSGERDAILERVQSGETQVITNCMVLTEGFDCQPLSCCILARPTRNLGLYIQMGGRVLRTLDDDDPRVKEDAIIIDHSGNLYEHGFLEDDHGWRLSVTDACAPRDERQKKLDEKKPITCVQCAHVYTGQLVCPKCGHKPERKGKYVETRHADLIEVRSRQREEAVKKAEKERVWTKEEKQHWYSMFYSYALSKNHNVGSVAHKYKAKFGVWPQDMKKDAVEPDRECLAFIKHLNIKNAYRNKARKEREYQQIKQNYVPTTERGF